MAASYVEVVSGNEGMMIVPVRSCTGENFSLDVAKSVSSEILRELIADKFQINPGAMELTSRGHSTDSNDGMCAVRSGCAVNVFPKSRTGLDTLPNLSIGQSKTMKPQDIFGLLSSLDSSSENAGAKVTIVLSGENGQVAETQLDLADAAKLIHAASRVKERKAKRKRNYQADIPDATSSIDTRKRDLGKGKGKAEASLSSSSRLASSNPIAMKTTIMTPPSTPNANTLAASSSTANDSTSTDDDEDSNEYDSNDEAESTADIIDVLSKFDDIASFLPKELFEKLGAKRHKSGVAHESTDVDDDDGYECDTDLGDIMNEAFIKRPDPTQIALEVERQRALLEDELRKTAKEMHQRKMENIRTTRKLDLLRCKRDAKNARLARLKREKGQKGTASKTSTTSLSSRKLNNSTHTATPQIAKSATAAPCTCTKLAPTNKSSAKKITVVPGFAGMRRGFLC